MTSVKRLLPVLGWLPGYDRRWLRGDVAAGIAVTALIVPKNLGYAGIAGVPLQNGLYAAAAGAVIYALFCTSRHISTGPSSSLAAVAGGAVVVTGLAGDEAAGTAILRLDGALFFATAEALEDRIRGLADSAPAYRALVLDLEGVNFVDAQGSAKLAEIHDLTRADGVELRLAGVKPQVRAVLVADGVVERIGADHVHGNVHAAVEAQPGDADVRGVAVPR